MIKAKEKNKSEKGVCMEGWKYREGNEGQFHWEADIWVEMW